MDDSNQKTNNLSSNTDNGKEIMIQLEDLNLSPAKQSFNLKSRQIIRFNVGGKLFETLQETLAKKLNNSSDSINDNHVLDDIVNDRVDFVYDERNDAIFLDRSPKCFEFILNYLRKADSYTDQFFLPTDLYLLKELLNEAYFYNLSGLIDKIEYSTIFFSKILTSVQRIDLLKLIELKDYELKLIYRATVNGFSSHDFHRCCDGISKTLTIIKVKDTPFIFGGYTDIEWESTNNAYYKWKQDKKAFLFSLVNRENRPVKIECQAGYCAIYCDPQYGPSFGAGCDFKIASNSNINCKSYSKLGCSFKLPGYEVNSEESNCFLAGSFKFFTQEIEVYALA
jgi:hypothetical protein